MSIPANEAFGTALTRPDESILGIGYSLLISAERTGGEYELMRFVVPAGHGPPPHIHEREVECFYIVDGEFEVLRGEQTIRARPGDFVHLPRNVPHAFRNTSAATGSFLCWVIPGNLAGFFDAFKRPWPADSDQPPPVTEEDIGKMLAAAAQYGIKILI